MRTVSVLVVVLFALSFGCGEREASNGGDGASGGKSRWCGIKVSTPQSCTGDEVIYVEYTLVGQTVAGKSCEAYDKECYPIQAGKLVGDTLTYFYTFGSMKVTATFKQDAGGKIFTGSFFSTKCDCTIPKILYKI